MSANKPSTAEEEYFLQEEVARRQREAIKKAHEMEQAERQRLQQLHYMKCPKCGFDLHTVALKDVEVDQCSHCGGFWLDANELERLSQTNDIGLLRRIVRFFQREAPSSPAP